MPQKLILKSHLSPGDIVLLTATLRDLHRARPNEYLTDVRTTAMELWENNPYIASLNEKDSDVHTIVMHYPLINDSNSGCYHFIHGYTQFLEKKLRHPIPVTEFKGDIHISELEKSWLSQVQETGYEGDFWILMAGGKYDFTAKWWDPAEYQKIVDHFRGRIQFVQCGQKEHWHPKLEGVIDLLGKTDTRQFVRLMYHAAGVVCPVTFAMHLAAAVETRPGMPRNRACVVIAGGREPAQWEAYPHHQYISTNGMLDCCQQGGCWKSRCQPVHDGDQKDRDLCTDPVQLQDDLQIPRCMKMITAEDVIRRIEMYYEGGSLKYINESRGTSSSIGRPVQNEDPWTALAEQSPFYRAVGNHTHIRAARNASCGDELTMSAIIDDSRVITDIGFEGAGCVISQAAATLLCRAMKGKHVDEALDYRAGELLKLLPGQIPRSKKSCAVLSLETLKSMLHADRVTPREVVP